MNKTKKSLLIGAILTVLGVGTFATSAVFAKGIPGNGGYMTRLVNAIATTFHLNPTDVQRVVDEQQQQEQATRAANTQVQFAARLTDAVKNGKLTQAQADAITAKQTEIKTFMSSLLGKSAADRQAAIKAEMYSLAQWMKDNAIPSGYLGLGFGMRGGFDHGVMPFRKATNTKLFLDQAVKDGTLTQAQEDLIIAKQTEIKTFMDSLKGKTYADRQAAIKTEMDAVTQWAKDNNLPVQYVWPFGNGVMLRGGMDRGWSHPNQQPVPMPAATQ